MLDHGPLSLKPGSFYCLSPLKALDGTILALSVCVCLHVRIYCENIHLGEQVHFHSAHPGLGLICIHTKGLRSYSLICSLVSLCVLTTFLGMHMQVLFLFSVLSNTFFNSSSNSLPSP